MLMDIVMLIRPYGARSLKKLAFLAKMFDNIDIYISCIIE